MPVEFSRTTVAKSITLPNNEIVKIPLLTKVSFIDASDRYQETQHDIDNSVQADRVVHIVDVYPSGNHAATSLQVERIDDWKVFDETDRGQESIVTFDNINGESNTPPSFDIANGGSHLKTHTVRYFKDINDKNSNWVEVEYIDQFTLIDASDRYQETTYELTNPTQDQADAMALDADPNVTDPQPYRTDPFQNIVNFSSGTSVTLQWTYALHETLFHLSGAGNTGTADLVAPPGSTLVGQYVTTADIALFNSPTIPPGFTVTGDPSVTPNSISFAAWQFVSAGGFVPGLHVATTASIDLVGGPAILSLGVGFYGDAIGQPGIFAGGYSIGSATLGTISVDATAISVNAGGPAWTRTYAEISVSAGAISITQVFAP